MPDEQTENVENGSATENPNGAPENAPADLGEAGKKALAAERKAAREAQRRADELATRLKEFEDRDKTELQRAIERAEAAEKQIADATSRALRLEIAAEKGLTPKQAARLIGSSREELEADADALLAEFAPARTIPSFDSGARTDGANGSPPPDINSAIRRMAGRG